MIIEKGVLYMEKYTLGLDIGITSVGSCAISNSGDLVEMSVRKFNEAKEASEARNNRSARRTLRRKKWRKEQLIAAFNDFNIIKENEIRKDKYNYLSFYGKGEDYTVPDVYTIYHLRQKALKEQVSKRELLLCLYNILQARGHFLLENIDFTRDGITFDAFKDKFYALANTYIDFADNRDLFEKEVLEKLFNGLESGKKDLEKKIKTNRFTKDEESDENLINICYVIAGGKKKIGKLYGESEEGVVDIEILKKKDELNEVQSTLVELYDICRISQILKDGCNYVCDVAVKEIDRFRDYKEKGIGNISDFEKVSKKRTRSYKNLNNSYPNGLYVKEVQDILHNQCRYYPEITPEFIEVCSSIASAKIPYYVGPLGNEAKNVWAEINGQFKYSYDYTIKHFNTNNKIINEFDTIRAWKEKMVSHCTYLPEEIALPKGSLIGEIFSILNEMNNFICIDKNEDSYFLTREDKINVLDKLFLKSDKVTLKEVKELLDLKEYKSKQGTTKVFNNRISIYRLISNYCENIRINSVIDLLSDKDKLNKIENLILDINLFDEGSLKLNYFISQNYEEDVAKKLSSIKSNGFYSFSKKFILETPMNQDEESMIDILFNDNDSLQVNNQQVIITNACDKEGNKIDFLANKYEKILKDNNNNLTIDLIIDKGKPLMPISRSVVRALNETFKVYNAYIELHGAPDRVIVETAKGDDGIKDFTEQNGSTMKHYKKMSMLVDYLGKQLKEKDQNAKLYGHIVEDWSQLEEYYNSQKLKIELYIRQNGIDLLTNKKIDITHLENYEIDHILPRGFGDDSQDNKMLISKIINGMKGDRLPIEFLESRESSESITPGRFKQIVNNLFDMKMISSKKRDTLLLTNQNEAELFINQNLVDTRYIISQFVSILKAFNKVNNYNTTVACMNGSFTKLYRDALYIKKDRNVGDQHHAIDAACLCIADKCLNTYFPNYDRMAGAYKKKGLGNIFGKYEDFVKELNDYRNMKDSSENDRLKRFIHYAYKKAFNQDVYKLGKEADLIQDIKSTTPLISWKVEKNFDGELFNATLYKPKQKDDPSVLSILGVNNDKRSFESINCIAVDFYKVNKKHYAIHIPFAIVDNKGKINEEQYIKLIKKHYKADELLVDGELNTKLFRFRAFKNDVVYDTHTNEPYLFNLGSVAIKKLEIKPLNNYSYDSVYNYAREIYDVIRERFNVKTNKNKNGVEFNTLNKEIIISYICEVCGLLDDRDKHEKYTLELVKDINNIFEFSKMCAYYSLLANTKYAPPAYNKQYLPVANSNQIKADPNAEYVKLKYNVLGVRFKLNDKGKLIVSGPRCSKNGGFKKIKREEFHWTISKNMLK